MSDRPTQNIPVIKADCLTCDDYHDIDMSILRIGERMRAHLDAHPTHKIYYNDTGKIAELKAEK